MICKHPSDLLNYIIVISQFLFLNIYLIHQFDFLQSQIFNQPNSLTPKNLALSNKNLA